MLTMHLGPNDILLALDVQFTKGFTAKEASATIAQLGQNLKEGHTNISSIYIEARSL